MAETHTDDTEELVRRWHKSRSDEDKERALAAHIPYVKGIISRLRNPVPQLLDSDDLFQYGMMGLMSSLERYDPERGVLFRTLAYTRIRGAATDAIRQMSSNSRYRKVSFVPIEDASQQQVAFDEPGFDAVLDLLPEATSNRLYDAVRQLSPRHASIVLFSMHGLPTKAIAALLEVSTSRVTQEKELALLALRTILSGLVPPQSTSAQPELAAAAG